MSNIALERRSEFEVFETKWQNLELCDLQHVISDAKKVMQLDKKISDKSLVLEISSPDQEHLTLIDLPGFFVSTGEGQSPEDIALVNEIARRYVSNKRAVVLAIVSGKNDFENQLILENLKTDKQYSLQPTLGIITAPDAIEAGSHREDEYVKLVRHNTRGLGYGWHVLRNPGYDDIKTGVDRDALETQFFTRTSPWNCLDPETVGSQTLKKRLSSILKTKVAESLPEVQEEVNQKLQQTSMELSSLGESR